METVPIDLSRGSFAATHWNQARGWLELRSDTPRPDSSWIDTTGLTNYFPLEDLSDDAGTANAVAHGAPEFTEGLVANGLSLDGASWIEIPHSAAFASSDLTVSFWVNVARFEGTIFSKDGQGDESSNIEVGAYPAFSTFFVTMETPPGEGTIESRSDEAQTGRWYHLTVAWGAGGTQLFVDGALVAESASVTDPTVNDWPFVFGGTGSSSVPGNTIADDPFTGQLDELSIWSRRLTPTEIRTVFEHQRGTFGSYTSPVLDAGLDLTWTSLSWQPNRPTLKGLSVLPEPGYGAGRLSADGLVALLHLDETGPGEAPGGADVADSAREHHGTVAGASFGGRGLFNGAMAFDGDGEFVDLGPLQTEGSQLTLAAWVHPTGWASDDARILSKTLSDLPEDHTWMVSTINSDHRIRVRLKLDGTTEVFIADTAHLVANEWAHVVVTYDSVELRIYLDGRLRDRRTPGGALTAEPTVHAAIGANPDGSHAWLGLIDEVSIWQRALDESEVANLFNRGGLSTRLRIRFCDRPTCSGDFVGPDGTPDTFYSELLNAGPDLPRMELTPVTSRYVQAEVILESADASFSPELFGITLGGR
jgi:hypothetical protein